MAAFAFSVDFPASESSAPRVNKADFGGYEQRVTHGLNPLVENWSIQLGSRTLTEIRAASIFLENQRGTTPFTWTTPFGETGQFVCSEWSARPESLNLLTLTAEFVLTYVPGQSNITKPAAPGSAFAYCHDLASSRQSDSNSKLVQFGDGYAQRVTMGLNPQTTIHNLSFLSRSNSERDLIRAYFRGAAGVQAFTWTDPQTGATGKYVCQDWSITYNNFNNNNIQAKFRQVFEP